MRSSLPTSTDRRPSTCVYCNTEDGHLGSCPVGDAAPAADDHRPLCRECLRAAAFDRGFCQDCLDDLAEDPNGGRGCGDVDEPEERDEGAELEANGGDS